MLFRTEIEIPKADFEIQPAEQMLFVGSCFADNLGRRFVENRFRATVNPFGVMYNPASILHTVEKSLEVQPRVAVFTLGTNHVYILKETGEIVDNCQKRPQRLFEERELSVEECAGYLQKAVDLLKAEKVIITVSPIRYAKYGYHGSQLSKATLQLAADKLVKANPGVVSYFPAYEIMMDELREYRFYADDMLHPSTTAIEYIWERFTGSMLSPDSLSILKEWKDIQKAINHKPFQPESEAYKRFISQTLLKMERLNEKFPYFDMTNEVEMIKKKF